MIARRWAAVATAVLAAFGPSAAGAQEPASGSRLALVVEVAVPPIVGGDGRLLDTARPTLDRLTQGLEAVDGSPLPWALSVSPVLVEQLRLVGPAGARTYAALVRAASRHSVLTRPYADLRLTQLDDADVAHELEQGLATLRRTLDADPLAILHAPGLTVSSHLLDIARSSRTGAVLAPAEAVGNRPLIAHGVSVVPARPPPPEGDILATFGARSELAVVVDVLDPRLRDPALAGPSITPVPLEVLVAAARPGSPRFPSTRPPPASYVEAVGRAEESLAAFASYALDDNAVRNALEVILGVVRSSIHWEDRWTMARDLATVVVDRVSEERDLVFASQGSVTLTSQRGTVPVTVINLASYPVRVRVRVSSAKLSFPDGETRVLTVSPQGDTTTFVAEARTPGTFPLAVDVTSPDGSVSFGAGEVLVRSIAARTPALVLTGGAALFLVLWSLRALARRRRSRR